jgi:hypothetical protein
MRATGFIGYFEKQMLLGAMLSLISLCTTRKLRHGTITIGQVAKSLHQRLPNGKEWIVQKPLRSPHNALAYRVSKALVNKSSVNFN